MLIDSVKFKSIIMNMICIRNFLTIQRIEGDVKRNHSSKSFIKTSSSQSKIAKNLNKVNLKKTQKKSKPKCYKISNENEITLFGKDMQYKFYFNQIGIESYSQHSMSKWFPFKNVVERISQSSEGNTSIIFCHNYSDREYYKLLRCFGRQLVCNGYSFDVHVEFGEREGQEQRVKRKFGQAYELQDILSCKCFELHEILVWFRNTKDGFAFGFCSRLCQFERHIGKQVNKKNQNLTAFISTLIQQPTLSNVDDCLSKLKSCQGFKQRIFKISQKQKEPFSFRKMSHEPQFQSKSLRSSFMKNSQGLNQNKKMLLATKNERMFPKFNYGSEFGSSSDSSLSDKQNEDRNSRRPGGKQRKIGDLQSKQMRNILVENVNMKWEIKVMKQQFESQAAKYIEKTTTKYQSLKEERTYWLQENSRLRKENDQILIQNNSLKMKCSHLQLAIQQFKIDEEQRMKVLFDDKQGGYERSIEELTSKLSIASGESNKLKEELMNAKFCIEDGRKRTRDKIQELQDEIDVYKKIIQQMKTAYEQLDKEHGLEMDRKQLEIEKMRRSGDPMGLMGENHRNLGQKKGRILSSGVLELQKELLEVVYEMGE